MFFVFIFWNCYSYCFTVQLVAQQHNVHLLSPALFLVFDKLIGYSYCNNFQMQGHLRLVFDYFGAVRFCTGAVCCRAEQ